MISTMKKKLGFSLVYILAISGTLNCYAANDVFTVQCDLTDQYRIHCNHPSDINEHLPRLRELATECSTVTELGLRSLVSTWGLLLGLAESPSENRSYIGIDLGSPPYNKLKMAETLSQENGVAFQFIQANDMKIDIGQTDMLFIDTLHTYCHLTFELEKFSPKVTKYIAMHDTSEPWGDRDDVDYNGDYSEYPAEYDRTKRGLWPAVEDFLERHPEWALHKRYLNNHGLTILKRTAS